MKKLSIFLLLTGFFLLFLINNASAVTVWANGVNQASGWYDAEKDNVTTDDDYLCWAATAANVLIWSGWNAGYANEDTAFDFFVAEDPVDVGGWMENAWNFWFDGSETGGHFAGSTHTGYYTTAEYTANYQEEMDGGSDVMDDIMGLLADDWGVGIAVRGNMDHAVTAWGVETDAEGNIIGIWLTDSDNDKSGSDPRPNELNLYDVTLTGSTWYLDDFYGSDTNYIREWQALKMTASVPEPATMILLGIGILGLGAFRRRLFKKS